jgi:HSP20 family protein
MIVLRRGRTVSVARAAVTLDDALQIEPGNRRQRQECFAPWRPPIEAWETTTELTVRAEIGGVSDRDLEVLVEDDELIIRGERNVARSENHRLYHESRVQYGPFEASVRLPFPINVEQAVASYRDGMLIVSLPRLTPFKVPMRIAIDENGSERGGR